MPKMSEMAEYVCAVLRQALEDADYELSQQYDVRERERRLEIIRECWEIELGSWTARMRKE